GQAVPAVTDAGAGGLKRSQPPLPGMPLRRTTRPAPAKLGPLRAPEPRSAVSGRDSTMNYRIACLGLACVAFATPASADLLTQKALSTSIAVTMAMTAIENCKAAGYRVSATVVGLNGEVIAQIRGDGTGPHTMENSFKKAFTARTFRIPSGE